MYERRHSDPLPPPLPLPLKPVLQVVWLHWHAPPEHVALLPHTLPQLPQLVRSVAVLTQLPPQSVCPVGHPQRPPAHITPGAHWLPQVPQLLVSLARLTQPLGHWACPVGHPHWPALRASG